MKRTIGVGVLSIVLSCVVMAQMRNIKPTLLNNQGQEKTPPTVTLNPGNLDFGEQVTQKNSKPQRVLVTNTGQQKLYINSAAINGDNWQDFTLVSDTCTGNTLEANKSCVIDISFTPAAKGNRQAMIVLTDAAANSPQNIVLMGKGINSVEVPPS